MECSLPTLLGNQSHRQPSASACRSDHELTRETPTCEGEDSPGSLQVGDSVSVFSRTFNEWFVGEIVELMDGGFLRVEYDASCHSSRILRVDSQHWKPIQRMSANTQQNCEGSKEEEKEKARLARCSRLSTMASSSIGKCCRRHVTSKVLPAMINVVHHVEQMLVKPNGGLMMKRGDLMQDKWCYHSAVRHDLFAFRIAVLACLKGRTICACLAQLFRVYWWHSELLQTIEVCRHMRTMSCSYNLFDFLGTELNSVMNLRGFGFCPSVEHALRSHSAAATNLYVMVVVMLCLTFPAQYASDMAAGEDDIRELRRHPKGRAECFVTHFSRHIPPELSLSKGDRVATLEAQRLVDQYLEQQSLDDEDDTAMQGFVVHYSWFQQPAMVAACGHSLALGMRLNLDEEQRKIKHSRVETSSGKVQNRVYNLEFILKSAIQALLTDMIGELEAQSAKVMFVHSKVLAAVVMIFNFAFVYFFRSRVDEFLDAVENHINNTVW